MKIIKFKRDHNNQNGFSIVMVISALALVAAGTAYIIDINKNNKNVAARSRSTSVAETERRRIAGILSSSETCKLTGNFGGQDAIRPDISQLIVSATPAVIPLVQKNASYFAGILKLTNISTWQKTPGSAKGYELILDYSDPTDTVLHKHGAFVGKPHTQIRIPMYMKLAGTPAKVVDCYAISENSELDTAIQNACSPDPLIPSANKASVLNKTTEGNIAQCQQNVITDTNYSTSYSSNPYTTCVTNTPPTPDYKFMSGVNISQVNTATDVGTSIQFQASSLCGNILGVGAASAQACTLDQRTWKMNNNTLSCEDPGAAPSPRDSDAGSPLCAAGNLLFHKSASSTSCVNLTCPTANDFFQKLSAVDGTVSCYPVKTKNCDPGQYISGFDGTGTPSCKDLPVVSGTCGTQYGTAVSRTTAAGANGNLTCSSGVTISKACSSPGVTTFPYELTSNGANCTTY